MTNPAVKTSVKLDPQLVLATKRTCLDLGLTLSAALDIALRDWLRYPHKGGLPPVTKQSRIDLALRAVLPASAAEVGADLLTWFFTPGNERDQAAKLALAGLIPPEGHLRSFVELQTSGQVKQPEAE